MTGTKLAVTIGAAALLLAACSSSSTSGNTSTHTTATHSAPAQPAAPASSAPAAAAADPLTGLWNGQYGGSYQGTFVLHWRQAGSKLSGHIHISNPGSSMPIHGTVNGGSIQFGTVGSYAITYSGTVSGGSMSGTYHVANGSGGNWSASKG